MKKFQIAIQSVLLLLIGTFANGQTQSFYERFDFLNASPSVFQEGARGMANPANLRFLKNPEYRLNWTIEHTGRWSLQDWSVVGALPGIGFGLIHRSPGERYSNDYYLSLGFGKRSEGLGIGYSWSSGNDTDRGYERLLTLGGIFQSNKFLSIGLLYTKSLESRWGEGFGDIGFRPLGTSGVTLFADAGLVRYQNISDALWSAGIILEPARGINLIGRYFKDKSFTIGISICLGNSTLSGQPHFDTDKKINQYSCSFRYGGMRPSIIDESVNRNKKYVPINLKGTVAYNKYILFDSGTHRLMDILADIRAAADDPRIAALVLNLSGLRIYPEHAWEIREELKRAREFGKQVIVFIDDAGMTHYHLASVADKIVLDPSGSLRLAGFAMGRTYLKGTLDKLGLGFEPWRFNIYKSAPERYSHKKMSDADREQNQAYIDDRYELVREEICFERGITTNQFDMLVNYVTYIIPDKAIEVNLVDTLGRWSDRGKIIKNLTGNGLGAISRKNILGNTLPRSDWGERDRIAVVYGLGDCEMDRGIRARWLVQLFLRLARDKTIRAVVFRVDSPGGLTMPSDIVAQAVKKCDEEKPVVVSQGQMAASGGYLISTYADSILAGPNTVTGSIGIYGGWVYDKGFGDKIGMSSDYVRRGIHADLTTGIRLPYVGLQIPARNLTAGEYNHMENVLRVLYDDFVSQVSVGRGITIEKVKEIAEGRIYSGLDGKEIGLVDKIGGLMTAIDMARALAGIEAGKTVDIIEIPKSRGLFNLRKKLNPFGISLESDPVYNYLRLLTENRGQPLPMLEPGMYPEME